MHERRPLELRAVEDSVFLRLGREELLAVVESDAGVATSLLRSVSSHLMSAAESLRAVRGYAAEQGVDFTALDAEQNQQ